MGGEKRKRQLKICACVRYTHSKFCGPAKMRMAFEVRHFFCENDASPLKKHWERGGREVPDEPYRIWKGEGEREGKCAKWQLDSITQRESIWIDQETYHHVAQYLFHNHPLCMLVCSCYVPFFACFEAKRADVWLSGRKNGENVGNAGL